MFKTNFDKKFHYFLLPSKSSSSSLNLEFRFHLKLLKGLFDLDRLPIRIDRPVELIGDVGELSTAMAFGIFLMTFNFFVFFFVFTSFLSQL